MNHSRRESLSKIVYKKEVLRLVHGNGGKSSQNQSVEMGRSPCCDENGLKKGPWTPEEDQKLVSYVQKHGHGSWRALPKLAGLC